MVKYCKDHLSIMLSAKLQKHRTREIRQGKALFSSSSLLSTSAQFSGALCLLVLKVHELCHLFPWETFPHF